jgi:hypothetical protein
LIVNTENFGTLTTPSGWTLITNLDSGTGQNHVWFYWKRAASSSEANVSVGSGSVNVNCVIVTMRNCVTGSTPIDTNATSGATTSTSTLTIPGVTTAQGGNDVLYISTKLTTAAPGANYNSEANAGLISVAERLDVGSNGVVSIGAWTGIKVAAGASGNMTVTQATVDTDTVYACISFLK